ncbi:MAG: hypothetical protein JNN03_18930 [Rubrivivax sp.]|nr:hypothetical protein [Rubrivivax sp.]
MKRYELTITLRDAGIFSRRNATEGARESLPIVPGAALWGRLCAYLFEIGHPSAKWVASGCGIRFGDARPLAPDGGATYPAPLCWHCDKTAIEGPLLRHGVGKQLRADLVLNGLHADLSRLGQARALPPGFVALNGAYVMPRQQLRLRTTVVDDAEADNQLFGYRGLVPRQGFRATVWLAPEAVAAGLEVSMRAAFLPGKGRAPVTLGRSRSAEYGRVACDLRDVSVGAMADVLTQPNPRSMDVWLLSDACLRGPQGAPTLIPTPEMLGLPSRARLDTGHCFVRHRRYDHFNAHRGGPGLVHQCLVAGSVLRYVLDDGAPFSPDDCRRAAEGLGTLREWGLGEVWVNPPMLAGERPVFTASEVGPSDASELARPTPVPSPATALVQWASARHEASAVISFSERVAAAGLVELAGQLRVGRAMCAVSIGERCGPGRTQWARLAQAARDADEASAFFEALSGRGGVLELQHRVADRSRRVDDRAWHLRLGSAEEETLNRWMLTTLMRWQEEAASVKGASASAVWARLQRAAVRFADEAREAELDRHERLMAASLAAEYQHGEGTK